jgi:hypothetical protein
MLREEKGRLANKGRRKPGEEGDVAQLRADLCVLRFDNAMLQDQIKRLGKEGQDMVRKIKEMSELLIEYAGREILLE